MELNICQAYDQMLLGKREICFDYYFDHSERNQKVALKLLKYALTYYMNWTPDDIYNNLTYDILKDLKLDKILKYIEFPCELNKEKDTYYIAVLLYPRKFEMNRLQLTINCYKEILEGRRNKFPKEYLSGQIGYIRAQICFQYLMVNYLSFSNVDEMYHFFATPEGIKLLKKYKLGVACSDLFKTALDFLHETLPKTEKNYFLYNYYKFLAAEKYYKKKGGIIND